MGISPFARDLWSRALVREFSRESVLMTVAKVGELRKIARDQMRMREGREL